MTMLSRVPIDTDILVVTFQGTTEALPVVMTYWHVAACPQQWLTQHGRTSSTAQGGGGSFKNRKPIGEVGCCESRMAERIH